jgi:hypothetical protein
VPRYLITTPRALRGRVATAHDAVRDAPGVEVINAGDPDMVTIETSAETAAELKRKLGATHFVDPETRHRLQ